MMKSDDIIAHIRYSGQLAAVLEVSGWPKPGNVHRTRNHHDSRYEHFLAGSIALGRSLEMSAIKGLEVAEGRIEASDIGIGRIIKRAVSDMIHSHNGGNTHLGVSILFAPLASAAAEVYAEREAITPPQLQNAIKEIVKSTTPVDAVNLYEAIVMASSPLEMGRAYGKRAPDLYDPKAKEKILEDNITLFDVMVESSSYDVLAREFVTGLNISFSIGYKELLEVFNRTSDINIATVHAFLKILSEFPDTFIARKIGLRKVDNVEDAVNVGIKETMWISETAKRILDLGGLTSDEGRALIWKLDEDLHRLGEEYNPGTTADLTAASLMIALLCGLKF